MQGCFQERAFYYWRHGLYGHVIQICEFGSEQKPPNIFLHLFRALAHSALDEPDPAMIALRRLQPRSDLALVYKMAKFVIYERRRATAEVLDPMRADIAAALADSNTLSIYYTALIAWFFGKADILALLLRNADEKNWMILQLHGWMELPSNPRQALTHFHAILQDRQRSFDPLVLYGLSLGYAALGETSD
jgi:hypothetical protein